MVMQKVDLEHMSLYYFSLNDLNFDSQHAYKTDYLTYTTLTDMTDKCFSYTDKKIKFGNILLDFNAVFDIVDPSVLLTNLNVDELKSNQLKVQLIIH